MTLEGFWPSLHLGDQADLTHLKSYCKQAKEQSQALTLDQSRWGFEPQPGTLEAGSCGQSEAAVRGTFVPEDPRPFKFQPHMGSEDTDTSYCPGLH